MKLSIPSSGLTPAQEGKTEDRPSEAGPRPQPPGKTFSIPPSPLILPPFRQAKEVYNKPCGTPEKMPLSLRDLTTALADIGDLFCLSLHVLTSAFLHHAAPHPGLPAPLCVLLSLEGVL